MWLDSDAGLALASDEPLGVTKGSILAQASPSLIQASPSLIQASPSLIQASPLRAAKRLGNKQRSLLNRAARAGQPKSAGRSRGMQARRAYNVRSVNRGSAPAGYNGGQASGNMVGDGRLQNGGGVEYMRLTGRLSGQGCESVEGGVIVRRGC